MSSKRVIRRALISVSDKTGLVPFARELARTGCEILSTGGTANLLREAGIAVIDVANITQFPEMMDGRIKTLHPRIHGGLLSVRDKDDHVEAMKAHDIPPIDMLVVNLYPFEETIRRGADFETAIENIDIGGPAMVRAAAKNHNWVSVVTDPEDYEALLTQIAEGGVSLEERRRLAAKAFARTAAYDASIAAWFSGVEEDRFPDRITQTARRRAILRYGENPHQEAALYLTHDERPGAARARQHQGKELSYNNINDTDAAYECLAEFDPAKPTVVIVKHANPCGVGTGDSLFDAYHKALRCDPVSAFGGIIALNQPLDGDTAAAIAEIFTEVVIAPEATDAALAVFSKKKNLRLLTTGHLPDPGQNGLVSRPVAGGFLVQTRDHAQVTASDLKTVTRRPPDAQELNDLLFAFRVAKHVKSNAIVYAHEGATVGIGAGQMSRLDSSRIAARKAADAATAAGLDQSLAQGAVVASDAFFPFADGLLSAAEAGVTAVIQPGGSMRDDEVIAAADEAGLAMVFTGVRHFRH